MRLNPSQKIGQTDAIAGVNSDRALTLRQAQAVFEL